MSRHAKHRMGTPLATEVPVNAAADETTEGLEGTETNASTAAATRVVDDDRLTGPYREREMAADEATASERHDAGPSVANPGLAADADQDDDRGEGSDIPDPESTDEFRGPTPLP